MTERRTLYASDAHRSREDVLASLFALALASDNTHRFWLDSPWITNLVVLDNRYGQFRGLFPDDRFHHVRLLDYLLALHERDVDVRVMTRTPDSNTLVQDFTQGFCDQIGADRIHFADELHAKGIITDNFCITGSMNLTENGVRIKQERVDVSTDRQEIARCAHDFELRWQNLNR